MPESTVGAIIGYLATAGLSMLVTAWTMTRAFVAKGTCLAIRADCNRWHQEKDNTSAQAVATLTKEIRELKEMMTGFRDDFYEPRVPKKAGK